MSATPTPGPTLAIVGGGPAGLMAAETARAAGLSVDLYEAKGSVGRKFLIAGKGGMNLTHAEPRPGFDARYRERAGEVGAWLDDFDAGAVRAWAAGLGVQTFVGSSGRVFPTDLKAAPLLRGWVRRLKDQGVRFHVQHRWTGWDQDGALRLETPDGPRRVSADATVLALGGASWPQLGSDGAWQPWLAARGVAVAPLKPANCGFDIAFSAHMTRHAGAPLKPVVAHWRDAGGQAHAQQGECVLTETGIEGSLIYAIAPDLRAAIERDGHALLELDLAPGRDLQRLVSELSRPRRGRSVGEHLRRASAIEGAKAALVFEATDAAARHDPARLAAAIHRLALLLQRPRPLAETISSAGGVRLETLDGALMLKLVPGVFCAGEMLDWEAPTGGYLLTACLASGRRAAKGATAWLQGL
ncbi:TIGR03862 family flavoprotein [Pseudoxanthomonas spadix]|uniref:TIGR03862 family flavoprotein n=1 Tax=Pseudoxanthomonas spadix TaxID=415229 RepID=UPI000EFFC0E2|nr:TIGR03862 family flavoprotein [Pseudoxanthomonas spadix]MBP3973440.1 TIGR03862 family flavoprotein [Pseudoxanthomonas spadix]RMW94834.1 TIGR03862 family flavoprotein [Pseudoxanthomonas spadix]